MLEHHFLVRLTHIVVACVGRYAQHRISIFERLTAKGKHLVHHIGIQPHVIGNIAQRLDFGGIGGAIALGDFGKECDDLQTVRLWHQLVQISTHFLHRSIPSSHATLSAFHFQLLKERHSFLGGLCAKCFTQIFAKKNGFSLIYFAVSENDVGTQIHQIIEKRVVFVAPTIAIPWLLTA